MRFRLLPYVLLALLAVGCDDGGGFTPPPPVPTDPTVAGVNLDTLLAEPTEAERTRVGADLQQRAEAVVPVDVRVEARTSSGGVTVTVLSFTTPFPEGTGRFYGAVRIPARPSGSAIRFPLLVVVPASRGVVSTDHFLTDGISTRLGEAFAQVVMAAPGQTLRANSVDMRSSTVPDPYFGPYDLEVDLLRAFVRVALEAESDAVDPERIGYTGFGRGGTVALLLGARPSSSAYPFRPRAVAALAPYTSYAAPSFRDVVRRLLLSQTSSFPGADLIAERFLTPLRDRQLARADVREALLRWSPYYFAADLPETHLRHSRTDQVIGSDHSALLAAALSGRVNFVFVEGSGHESLFEAPDVKRSLASFLLSRVAGED